MKRFKTGFWLSFILICAIGVVGFIQKNASTESAAGNSITITIPGLPEGAKPLEMVFIPAGAFLMGSLPNEKDHYSNEGPQHPVTISQDYYLGKYEITQAQWQAIMGTNPARDYGIGNDNPVYYISWEDSQLFIQKLNELGLGVFRLPTESEWEYACKANTNSRFYWDDDLSYSLINDNAWYDSNSNNATHEVGSKPPNPWGLFDMSGNVWEWCEDDLHDNYNDAPSDGTAWIKSPRGAYRIARGGGWGYYARYCRSAYRGSSTPDYQGAFFGLRVLKTAS